MPDSIRDRAIQAADEAIEILSRLKDPAQPDPVLDEQIAALDAYRTTATHTEN